MPYLISEKSSSSMKNMMALAKVSRLPSPRVIKSHLPFYLLHPQLLDTSKVLLLGGLANVTD